MSNIHSSKKKKIMNIAHFNKVEPEFRHLVDIIFFSNNRDIDLSNFKSLLKSNYDIHYKYFLDRFYKSTEIFWENGSEFWENRLSLIFLLNDKNIIKYVSLHLEERMLNLLRFKHNIDLKYDIEYIQYLELCRIKSFKKENIIFAKNFLADLPSSIKINKIIEIINSFIPFVFNNIDDYVKFLTTRIVRSAKTFNLLIALEGAGVSFSKGPIVDLVCEIITERSLNDKNTRALFNCISNESIRNLVKNKYDVTARHRFIEILKYSTIDIIEGNHLSNIINAISLDPGIVDNIVNIYIDKLYRRKVSHKKANADKLIRLLKLVPQVSPKKILVYLSTHHKTSDIKYMLSTYSELQNLAAFA